MKTTKLLIAAVVTMAVLLCSLGAQAAGLTGGATASQPVTVYSASFHSPGGATNITTGYTNALSGAVFTPGSVLTIDLKMGANTVNVSNNVTLVVHPAFDTSTYQTTAAARIALLPSATGLYTETITNVASWGGSYVRVALENPSSNLAALTNVVIRVTSKVP